MNIRISKWALLYLNYTSLVNVFEELTELNGEETEIILVDRWLELHDRKVLICSV